MSEQNNTVASVSSTVKLMNIGRAWINDRLNDAGTSPRITIRLDQELGINIKIAARTEILLFANEKRTEVNPTTGQPYQDADYRVAIALPAEAVDAEIARQKDAREAKNQATPAAATVA